jgi:alpha-galactosidase
MVLSGDDLTTLPPARAAMLKKLLPPTGVAATFTDAELRVGSIALPTARMICLFNWDDTERASEVVVGARARVADFWSGASLAPQDSRIALTLPPRSARLLKVTS